MKFRKLIISAFIFSVAVNAFSLQARVISTQGKVEIQDGSMWVDLLPGDTVERGDIISTGFKSQAVFEVKGTRFTLGPLTRITIEQLMSSRNSDSTQLFIDSGSISAEVQKKDGKPVGFTVRSAVSTASVRGTGFEFNSAGDLKVRHGTVGISTSSTNHSVVQASYTDYESSETTDAAVETEAPSEPIKRETKVNAGQASFTNALTGTPSNPKEEKISSASVAKGSTVTAASSESVSSSSVTVTSPALTGDSLSAAKKEATVTFEINIVEE